MRIHRLKHLMLVALMLGLSHSAWAGTGGDPAVIAEHCVNRITNIAQTCVHRNQATAEICVTRMEALIDAGHPGQAQHLAIHCIAKVVHRSTHCIAAINHRTVACVHVLLSLGAPGLAELVTEVADEARDAVRLSRAAAIDAIQAAAPGT
ncbi:MAG: hypothetical protein HKO59_06025 [Phycisphaerales bacterium]|nr:hypothetical protein [Phycisphaerae bacterium]NNF41914.1 hypothetical protein [Phycisphaerales bacterium]NNM25530.1 hypothetical protein [Phycisphaerales bacterium]